MTNHLVPKMRSRTTARANIASRAFSRYSYVLMDEGEKRRKNREPQLSIDGSCATTEMRDEFSCRLSSGFFKFVDEFSIFGRRRG